MSSENTAAPQTPKAEAKGALDRYFKITERGSTIAAEFRGGLATFFAMSYIVVLNPLIIGLGKDASGNALGVPQVAAMTALVAGVMTILMGVVAKQPFAMAAGLGVNALLATTIASTPGLTWPAIMGLVVWAGVLMTILVLTGFRTAVFNAVPESLKVAIVVGIGFFIAFIGLVNAGIIRRMPDAAGTTVPVSFGVSGHLLGWPTLVFIFGLFLTIALFIRNVKGAILYGVLASTALSIILEKVVPSGSSVKSPTGWSLNVPVWDSSTSKLPNFSLFGSADLFAAFGTLGGMAAVLLIFTILISAFFDAMGTSVGLATEAGTIKDGQIENVDKVLLVDALGSVAGGGTSSSASQIFVESATGIGDFRGVRNRYRRGRTHRLRERRHRRTVPRRNLPVPAGHHRALRSCCTRNGVRWLPDDPPGSEHRLERLGSGYPRVHDHHLHAAGILHRGRYRCRLPVLRLHPPGAGSRQGSSLAHVRGFRSVPHLLR